MESSGLTIPLWDTVLENGAEAMLGNLVWRYWNLRTFV